MTGIHHITAIADDPQRTIDFYTKVLGLRLVKLTVNFDDPRTYHFYFGNETGTPGSILTFFPWPGAANGGIGSGQVVAIAFAAPIGSLQYWNRRLWKGALIKTSESRCFGERVLRFQDPDGLRLEIVETERADPGMARKSGPVAAAHALSGFHRATLCEASYEGTSTLLEAMGYALQGREDDRLRYRAEGTAAAIVDVLHQPNAPIGWLGAGTVHHIAFRTPSDDQQLAWRRNLTDRGFRVTPVIDRTYFHSIYFREPGGILFEIATDPPGFTVDEPASQLGERLMLPAWLETDRRQVERGLPVLRRKPIAWAPQGVETVFD
jgi:glyoxalase family protein